MPFIFQVPSLTTTSITKYDGASYSNSNTLTSGVWRFYGPTSSGVYLGLSYFGGCIRSTDLINWTTCTMPSGFSASDGIGGDTNGNIIMLCGYNTIVTTSDGVNWGSVVNLPTGYPSPSVTYVDSTSTWVITSSNRDCCYSTNNGASWTAGATLIPSPTNPWTATYAVQSNGASLIAHDVQPWGNSTVSGIYVSTGTKPGDTWTLHNPPGGAPNILVVKRTPGSNGRIVAAYGSSSTAYYSDNAGSTWTSVTLPSASSWQYSAYCVGLGFIIAVYNSTSMIYSADGITWSTLTNSSTTKMPLYGSKYNYTAKVYPTINSTAIVSKKLTGNVFPATVTSNNTSQITKSAGINGYALSILTASTLTNKHWAVAFNTIVTSISDLTSKIFYLYYTAGEALQTTLSSTAIQANKISSVLSISNSIKITDKIWGRAKQFVYSNSKWVGINFGTNKASISSDGMTYVTSNLPSVQPWNTIATNGTTALALAVTTNNVATTSDGVIWTSHTLPNPRTWSQVASNGTNFVAIALQSDKCAVSTDGTTWTEHSMPMVANWTSIAWNGSVYCAVSNKGICAVSSDGTTWTQHSMPDAINYTSIGWALGTFTAVAAGPTNLAAQSTDGSTWIRITMPATANWTQVGPGIGNI